jgi:hypothetical protein
MGRATEEEVNELHHTAREDEALRQAMDLVEQSSDSVRHSALGEAAMIDQPLPPFTRPEKLAETLERMHAMNRRVLVISLGALATILGVLAVCVGPASLFGPSTIVWSLAAGIGLGGAAIWLRREDPIWHLTSLQNAEGSDSWLERVNRIERTRRRYASRRALVVAAGVLVLGIVADGIGTSMGTPLSENVGKFSFIASIYAATYVWLRHRQFAKLTSRNG